MKGEIKKMRKMRKMTGRLITVLLTVLVLAGCSSALKADDSPLPPAATISEVAENTGNTAAAVLTETEPLTYVSIDVNPSIRLAVKDDTVLNAEAFNDDGESILLDSDVKGMTPEAALNTLIDAFAAGGYITRDDENASLVITACGDNSNDLISSLQETASQRLNELGLTCDVLAAPVDNGIADEAQRYGLTPGRYMLLEKIAEKEGLTLEQAKEKYGALKMGKLVGLADDLGAVFRGMGSQTQPNENDILTPEQQQILNEARNAFRIAMQEAQQTFKQARTQAQEIWKKTKEQILNDFKADKDAEKRRAAVDALKAQIEQMKQLAVQANKQAKLQAQEQFRAAVASLGLTDEQIDALTQWDFDYEWSFDFNWSDDYDGETAGGAQNQNGQAENASPQNDDREKAGQSGNNKNGER